MAELRTERSWTQEQLAEKVGVSARYLQSVEGGRENLTLESLAKIGNALRVAVSTLFESSQRVSPAAIRKTKAR